MLMARDYPSWIVTKVNAASISRNKGQLNLTRGRINLRKALIVFQFAVAQVFIFSALIIGKQRAFTIHKELGFDKEAVITMGIPINYEILNITARKGKR